MPIAHTRERGTIFSGGNCQGEKQGEKLIGKEKQCGALKSRGGSLKIGEQQKGGKYENLLDLSHRSQVHRPSKNRKEGH